MTALQQYHFLVFGASSYQSLPHRAQGIADALASFGVSVDYIEIPRSAIGAIRYTVDSFLHPWALERIPAQSVIPHGLRVHRPPAVPTSFRNSLTPLIDRLRFQRWFKKEFAWIDWSNTITWVMFPYWWKWYASRQLVPSRFLMYDIADDLSVYSTTAMCHRRMVESERRIAAHVDLVTYSADTMQENVDTSFSGIPSMVLPNAIPIAFEALSYKKQLVKNARPVIGFVGTINEKWIDVSLLEKVAKSFPECDIVLAGPFEAGNPFTMKDYPNVHITGLLHHHEVMSLLPSFDVALIPFKQNRITSIVNPMKLYEYAAAGLPIVTMQTDELVRYRDILSFANSHEAFIDAVRSALNEQSDAMETRKEFARQNTWHTRLQSLQETLLPLLELTKETKAGRGV